MTHDYAIKTFGLWEFVFYPSRQELYILFLRQETFSGLPLTLA